MRGSCGGPPTEAPAPHPTPPHSSATWALGPRPHAPRCWPRAPPTAAPHRRACPRAPPPTSRMTAPRTRCVWRAHVCVVGGWVGGAALGVAPLRVHARCAMPAHPPRPPAPLPHAGGAAARRRGAHGVHSRGAQGDQVVRALRRPPTSVGACHGAAVCPASAAAADSSVPCLPACLPASSPLSPLHPRAVRVHVPGDVGQAP